MKLSEVKEKLHQLTELAFGLPNGSQVPTHFHITEVGEITKDFMDCGGKVRREKAISFQFWQAHDFDHRLTPEKLASIISLAEKTLHLGNWEVEVEYQADTIGKYGLAFNGKQFELTTKSTQCLASDSCGTSSEKPKVKWSELQESACCTPGGGCC